MVDNNMKRYKRTKEQFGIGEKWHMKSTNWQKSYDDDDDIIYLKY